MKILLVIIITSTLLFSKERFVEKFYMPYPFISDISTYNSTKFAFEKENGNKVIYEWRHDNTGFRFLELDRNFNLIKFEEGKLKDSSGKEFTLSNYIFKEFFRIGNGLYRVDSNKYVLSDNLCKSYKFVKKPFVLDLKKSNDVSSGWYFSKDSYCYLFNDTIYKFTNNLDFVDKFHFPIELRDDLTKKYYFSQISINEESIFARVVIFKEGVMGFSSYGIANYNFKSKKWKLISKQGSGNMFHLNDSTLFSLAVNNKQGNLFKLDFKDSLWKEYWKIGNYALGFFQIKNRIFLPNAYNVTVSRDNGLSWDSISCDKINYETPVAGRIVEFSDGIYLLSNEKYFSIQKLENVSSIEENTSPNQSQIQAKAIVTNVTPNQITISNVLGKALTFATLEEANNYLIEAKGLMLIKLDFADKEPTYLKHYFE